MFKKGPKEKEKILRRLTEKEIQQQLYGFQTRGYSEPVKAPAPAIAIEPRAEKPNQPKASGADTPVKPAKPAKPTEPRNFYLVWQIALLAVFLIVIWISARQIIRIISSTGPSQAKAGAKHNVIKYTIPQRRR